ncbi:glycyl-tRNA synthetase [Wallemia mellicola]|uniref:glycine--tRNA ligase n=1 Tax=Wallemia mellicola TaxID=1708541 RepID=A0A4T0RCM7_9BASI|nr:glycyl-tRNA synthetase [Wallemia mellicola]TIC32757.1 glycyl-tRNA synthetase [Wallemia mellicola]TIC75585.1 glycyl-tRNA synthetase [Wallemia mellicola]
MSNRVAHSFDKAKLEAVCLRRFFFAPAFEIYGGCAGLYDYGPPGSALQANILDAWRKHFIIEEEMLEVDTTAVTLGEVLKTSGHVDKFTDWMTRDTKTGDIFRADHLIEAVLEARLKGDKEARGVQQTEQPKEDEKKKKKKVKSTAVKLDDAVVQQYETILAQIDNFDGEGLADLIAKHTIKSPETQNDLTKPVEFNLMFESSIGPTGQVKGYLRPETAQGHFVNFARLLEFNNGRVPFASAQIGKSFRNEISPKQGLLRVREFLMAEIEHYVDPLKKDHPRFSEVENVELQILPKEVQVEGKTDLTTITVGEAVKKGIIDNQTLGYFVARINLFLQKIGINKDRLRFRQHMSNEMAHYASDCWDAEIHTSYGWIECVGCADRSAYDLTVHAVRTGQPLVVREPLPEIKIEEKWAPEINKKKFGPTFRANQKSVESTIFALDQPRLECIKKEFDEQGKSDVQAADGNKYELTPELLTIEKKTFKETKREFTPNVIEPSFGIGRILYALLEHSFYAREQDESRTVLGFPPLVAPIKALVVPISNSKEFEPIIKDISLQLRKNGVASRVDDSSATIGKRYARNDELGTPYGITVDFATVKNKTITLRERDTTEQKIGTIDQVIDTLVKLSKSEIEWSQVDLPAYSGVQDAD